MAADLVEGEDAEAVAQFVAVAVGQRPAAVALVREFFPLCAGNRSPRRGSLPPQRPQESRAGLSPSDRERKPVVATVASRRAARQPRPETTDSPSCQSTASRFAFYDQSEDRDVADWGGDELFTPHAAPAAPRRPAAAPRSSWSSRAATAAQPEPRHAGPRRDRRGAAPPPRARRAAVGRRPAPRVRAARDPRWRWSAEPPAPAAVMPIPAGWAPVERDARRPPHDGDHGPSGRPPHAAAAAAARRDRAPAAPAVARASGSARGPSGSSPGPSRSACCSS